MILKTSLSVLAVALTAHPLVNEDVLEPSVRNEACHALSRAPTNAPAALAPAAWTNGQNRTQVALRLVSAQRADGRWLSGTNDVTAAAVEILMEVLR